MSKTRDDFVRTMEAEGVPPDVARRVLREAATIKRHAVLQANAEYPYNVHHDAVRHRADCRCWKGEVRTCETCEIVQAATAVRWRDAHLICDECIAFERLTEALKPYGITPERSDLNVRLHVPSGRYEGFGGLNVPAEVRP